MATNNVINTPLITLGGTFTMTGGAYTFSGTLSGNTAVTFPTSGTLATTSQITGLSWVDLSGTTQTAAVNTGYIISNASATTVTLPATAAEGSLFGIQGKGAAGWTLAQASGQTVHFGSSATTAGTGGSLASTNLYDSVQIVCITANTTFAVISAVGNLTVT